MDKHFYSLDAERRIALVREAVDAGRPLMIRWAELEPEFGDGWRIRAEAAADWLAEASSIADLGCGAMHLERCLRGGQHYIPVDLAQRDGRTLVLDLNKSSDLANLPQAEACALLGVMEYNYAPDQFVAALYPKYTQAVVSFNVCDERQPCEDRMANGWVAHFTHAQILEIFAIRGYVLKREHLFRGKRQEYLFDFRRS